MPQQRTIIQLGHAVLRQKAALVASVAQSTIQSLIEDLLVTLSNTQGVGIAAPQVGASFQIFIVASAPTPRYPDAPYREATVMINPKISWLSDEQEKGWEGCLSIPGIRGWVPRSTQIHVEYTTQIGATQKEELSGFIARVFQHEYDHLQGVSFLDRLETTRDIITEQEFHKLICNK